MAQPTLKKRVKKILKSPRLLLVSAIVLVLAGSLLASNKGLWRHVKLRHEISTREDDLAKLQSQEAEIMKHVELLRQEDQNTLERIARERYGMKKRGEIIYREN